MESIDYILEHLEHPEKLTDAEFVAWLHEEENFRLFEEVRAYREILYRERAQNGFCAEEEYRLVRRRIQRKGVIKLAMVAAACVVVGVVALSGWYRSPTSTAVPLAQEIPVGRKTAELTLADGRQISLEGNRQVIQERNENIASNSAACELNYREGKLVTYAGEQVWHTLKVPVSADYFVRLSDGTKVWLNCDTELRFPVDFTAERREVFLKGEAYFEVTKAETWPFIVRTDGMSIRVTGTKFDVKSYESEFLAQTTLVEGSVWVNEVELKPSQQFLLDRKSGKTEVKTVDTELYTDWTQGMFVFQSQCLEDVMNGLAKWYDVTVVYRDAEVKGMRFSGHFGRYDTIDDVLDILGKLEKVDFSRDGRTIVVSNR